MISRRQLIASTSAALMLAAPPAAHAQASRKPVLGVLINANPEPILGQFRAALAHLGYKEGSMLELDVRVAEGSEARLATMADELVAARVDIIVAVTTPAALAAKAATGSIPIVMAAAADPVGSGLVASLARPGGNITGVSGATAELGGKILGLFREAIPAMQRVGVLANAADPFHIRLIKQIEMANRSVNVDLRVYKVAKPEELAATFDLLSAAGIEAAIVQPTLPWRDVIAQAEAHRVPTASPLRGYAEAGGLFSYNGKSADLIALAAGQVDRILQGVRPADMPVQQPSRFELMINLRTAMALGLTLPVGFIAQADEVIE